MIEQICLSSHFGKIGQGLGFCDEHGGFIGAVLLLLGVGVKAFRVIVRRTCQRACDVFVAGQEVDQVAAWDQANSRVP